MRRVVKNQVRSIRRTERTLRPLALHRCSGSKLNQWSVLST
jgi:hypothetical protein